MEEHSRYIRESTALDDLDIDQCIISTKATLKTYFDSENVKKKPKKNMPMLSLENYNACNSYYLFLEDMDAHERATNLFPPVSLSTESINMEGPELYPFSERGTQLNYLNKRPVSFIILGKPGIGTKELGKLLADYWKCVFIHPETLIEEEIRSGSRTGKCIEFNLRCGRAIGIDIILKLVEKRVKSKTAQHRGFVICGFPLVANDLYEEDPVSSESAVFNVQEIFEDVFAATIELGAPPESQVKVQVSKTATNVGEEEEVRVEPPAEAPPELEKPAMENIEIIKEPIDVGSATEPICIQPDISLNYEEQINTLFSLLESPLVTIYVACNNADVVAKRNQYRFDISLGKTLNLEKPMNEDVVYTMFTKEAKFISEIPEDFEGVIPDRQEVDLSHLEKLIKLPRDFTACVVSQLEHYRFKALQPMERQILSNDPGFFIKLDGRVPPSRMLNSIKLKLQTLPIQKVLIPEKFSLVAETLGGEGAGPAQIDIKGMTTEEFFDKFKNTATVNKMFKYTMSDWGSKCPVSMKEGEYLNGIPEHAVHFMNKIFFLSSEDAYNKFRKNPRPYLVLPYPKPSCKIAIIGPKYSGKSSLAKCLSYLLDAEILSPYKLTEKYVSGKRKEYIEKCRSDAITEIMAQLEKDYQDQEKEEENIRIEKVNQWIQKVQALLEEYIWCLIQMSNFQNEPGQVSSFPISLAKSEVEIKDTELKMINLMGGFRTLDFKPPTSIAECKAIVKNRELLKNYLPNSLKYNPQKFVPPSVFDPIITEFTENAVKHLKDIDIELTTEDAIDMYKSAIKDAEERNEARGNYKGGWIIDGLKPDVELIEAINPKIVDEVFVLKDNSPDYEFLINRLINKDGNIFTEFRDLFLGLENINAAYRVPVHSTESVKNRFCMTLIDNIIDTMNIGEEEGTYPGQYDPEFLERAEEEEYFAKNPRQSVLFNFKLETDNHTLNTEKVVGVFRANGVNVTFFDVDQQPLKDIMLQVIRYYDNKYTQPATIFSAEDRVQEVEDFGEPPIDVGGEEGEGDEKAIQEDVFFDRRRFGDTFNFCPVAFHDYFVLWRGKEEHAVKYENKLYFLHDDESMAKFLETPKSYLLQNKPPEKIPSPRICVVGPPGSGKSLVSRGLARNLGLAYVNFDLMIIQKAKSVLNIKKHIGGKRLEDVPVEEIERYIVNGELLPEAILDALLPLWFEEPKRTTGFVIDGFPRRPCDVEYMVKKYLIPDLILELTASYEIALERLVNNRLMEWKMQINKERQARIDSYKRELEEWEQNRLALYREMLDNKRQERYAAKLEEEPLSAVEETKETDDEGVKPQISFQSIVDDEDVRSINRYLDNVMPEPEFIEESEDETEKREKIIAALQENYAKDSNFLKTLREYADGEQILWIPINGNGPVDAVFSQSMRFADKIKSRHKGIFERCYDVPVDVAEKLLDQGYYFLSPFGRMCPVQYSEGKVMLQRYLPFLENSKLFPLIYRYFIYFLAGKENRDKFKSNPLEYIESDRPVKSNLLPFRVAIIGPPCSGKTTVAFRFAKDLGLKYISIGRAIRYVLQYLPNSLLAKNCDALLRQGLELTPELEISCVEAMTLDGRSNSQGCVFDGFPNIRRQVFYLAADGILPHVVIDLKATPNDIMLFLKSRVSYRNLPVPSAQLIDQRYKEFLEIGAPFRSYLTEEYQNIKEVSVYPSKWGVWTHAFDLSMEGLRKIRDYYEFVNYDTVLSLSNMLVSPLEFVERRGIYKHFCPVCLHYKNKCISGGEPPNRNGMVQYKKFYYWLCQEHYYLFMENPEQFLEPLNPNSLPSTLPDKLSSNDIEQLRAGDFSLLHEEGMCMVCYLDKRPSRVQQEGNFDFAVKYNNKIYLFDAAECLKKFCEEPGKYGKVHVDPIQSTPYATCSSRNLPVLGFLEQYQADLIVKAVTHCSNYRPLLPRLNTSVSAALCIGLYLKVNNPRTTANLLPYYVEAEKKMHERFDKLKSKLSFFKARINPYIYYEEIIDSFDEPEWMAKLYQHPPTPRAPAPSDDEDDEKDKQHMVSGLINDLIDTATVDDD